MSRVLQSNDKTLPSMNHGIKHSAINCFIFKHPLKIINNLKVLTKYKDTFAK